MNGQLPPHPVVSGPYDRDRERDVDDRHRPIPVDDYRDRDLARERDDRPFPPPHHSNAGLLPIHQPVASRLPGAIHSPGGLLANHGSAPPPPLSAPSAQPVSFGPPLHAESGRAMPHSQAQNSAPNASQAHAMFVPAPVAAHHSTAGPTPNNPHVPSAPPTGPNQVYTAAQPQTSPQAGQQVPLPGQTQFGTHQGASQADAVQSGMPQQGQPILNREKHDEGQPTPGTGEHSDGSNQWMKDALTYLDQVKLQFNDRSGVYNSFLDIMKDFKSQAIDTPGVIQRVSELFVTHPPLISGFNTFLPPGYKIECDPVTGPHTIRVTTPVGTTIQTIIPRPIPIDPATGRPFEGPGSTIWPYTKNDKGELVLNPEWRPARDPPAPDTPPPAASALVPFGNGVATGTESGSGNGTQGEQRRGPVEFNHAISYVNKIKNRYQDTPEVYKQFLEILQTYQREAKPIQEVYAQVTTLFHTAPDLLEDFKQFLPESAGGVPKRLGENRPPEEPVPMPPAVQTPHSTPRADGQKMPPLGSFAAPASASKDSKKRPRGGEKPIQPGPQAAPEAPATGTISRQPVPAAPGSKKPKLSHRGGATDAPGMEPTLTPIIPEPYPHASAPTTHREELVFFDRTKKHLGNKSIFIEFLKVCNLFAQGIIDQETLYHKGAAFLTTNPDLLSSWRSIVGMESQDVVVTNRPAPPSGKVSLSNCRAYGPSYRLLPKKERLKPCSGRDELCRAVLNDEWASHPTWASEDSGFVAHRKNAFEEGLHRIEEERHDYDFAIEVNQKCIQLLEPIAAQMLTMTPAERDRFSMERALEGHSISVFKRICRKIYHDKGPDVVNDLFAYPFAVVPVLLGRLKIKDEEWRFSQREWDKVWHSQTENMYLRSLDHMGPQVKQSDKKNLAAKHLVDLIKTKSEQQRRERLVKGKAPRHQYVWDFGDQEVIVDLLRLLLIYTLSNGQHSVPEKERTTEFFESFATTYFEIPDEKYQDRFPKIQLDSGEEDGEDQTPAELTNGRSRRNGKQTLLRGVLDPGRNGSKTRGQKEESAASGSKETTPEVGSANEEEMPDAPEYGGVADLTNDRWMPMVPKAVILDGEDTIVDAEGELKADAFFPRPWYNLYANQTIFVFFSIFQTIYKRLREIKESGANVTAEIKRMNTPKPADELGLGSTGAGTAYFTPEDDPSTFWPKTVTLIEDYITSDVDENAFQDVLRHYYIKCGWKLYTILDQLKTLCRLALTCTSSDSKEKTPDLIQQYLNNRERDETSYQTEIAARKFAEKCVKDGEMFVITWIPFKHEAAVRWLQREDTTFYTDEMQLRQRWQYYISSYIRVDPTEGVPRSRLQKSVLTRNLPSGDADAADGDSTADGGIPRPLAFSEELQISICMRSYKMAWEAGTADWFLYERTHGSEREARAATARELHQERETRLKRNLIHNNKWMKGLSQEEVQAAKNDFLRWVDEGPAAFSGGAEGDVEVEMVM